MKKAYLFILTIIIIISACEKNSTSPNPPSGDILGCMDTTALNYNYAATVDDGSCVYTGVLGCTDPTAINYNFDCAGNQVIATVDDDCCTFAGTISASDRNALLQNITNQIIIPVHNNLKNDINNLTVKAVDFTNDVTPLNLSKLRNAWVKTYMSWQSVEMFNIGKAEEIDYAKTMNTYPCDTSRINKRASGEQTYNLNQGGFVSWAAQGLPALDYMLYGLNEDSNMIINYYTGSNGEQYLTYLNDVINQMDINTDLVIQDWAINKDAFINSNGNTATSSMNMLTNDFIYFYEKGLRSNKIGIPCGYLSGVIYPIGIEAYYRGNISKRLALKALNSCQDFFIGKGINSGGSGFSYDDILIVTGYTDLSADIIDNLASAEIEINNLNDDFRQQIIDNNTSMENARIALHTVVTLLKTEMLFALDMDVDYADSDGD